MYYYFDGTLAYCDPQTAVIDCGGVGYLLNITLYTYQQISGKQRVKLYAYQMVKEDSLTLYGFAEEEEKEAFLLLNTVSGVGPKAALAILCQLPPERFAAAVAAGDYRAVTKANGVGPKLAQRICLELKDKIAALHPNVSPALAAQVSADRAVFDDALAALVNLGYSKNDAQRALEKCTADNPGDLIRQALRQLANL